MEHADLHVIFAMQKHPSNDYLAPGLEFHYLRGKVFGVCSRASRPSNKTVILEVINFT